MKNVCYRHCITIWKTVNVFPVGKEGVFCNCNKMGNGAGCLVSALFLGKWHHILKHKCSRLLFRHVLAPIETTYRPLRGLCVVVPAFKQVIWKNSCWEFWSQVKEKLQNRWSGYESTHIQFSRARLVRAPTASMREIRSSVSSPMNLHRTNSSQVGSFYYIVHKCWHFLFQSS